MTPVLLLRIAAGLFAFFTLGHSYGFNFAPSQGVLEDTLFAAMRAYTFEMQGFTRSHWQFLRGFGHITTVLLVLIAVLSWQLGTLSKQHPQLARPLVLTTLLAAVALAALSWAWFFMAPAATGTLAALALASAWARMGKA